MTCYWFSTPWREKGRPKGDQQMLKGKLEQAEAGGVEELFPLNWVIVLMPEYHPWRSPRHHDQQET